MTPSIVRRTVPASAATLAAAGVDPVLARLFASRGVRDAADLDLSLAGLPAPSLMKGAGEAADRLVRAIDARERIVIVADYDADGATACAIGVRALAAMGADVRFLVPNRFEHGYGLTPEIVALARGLSAALIVTVDNGIASFDGVAAAAGLGIDVLVTDHHLPADRLPSPALIVDPNQPGCAFPSKHIAGVGVMFYVLAATRSLLRARGRADASLPNLASLLDLVALGTVADVVRLDRTNRILVDQGLRRIRAGRAHAGVAALFAVAARDVTNATAPDLGFVAGPRINAAGRLADMSLGIRCLLADDEREAWTLASELDRMNRERRAIESTIEEEALSDLDAIASGADGRASVCVHRANWHQGVVGIVASRLKDRVHRPVVVFAPGNKGELRGSGRSIAGFHLRDALDLVAKRAPGMILRFGGHAYAAGLTLREADLARFADAFEAVASAALSPDDLEQRCETDGELSAGELTIALAHRLRDTVWGPGFPPPRFDASFRVAGQRVVGQTHTRLALARDGESFDAILFRHADPLPGNIHAVFRPEVNRWQGTESLELVIEHWAPL
ncbi:Single-stranded-DNA-specific exonuclease RecJ [Burkholderiales bacterium]|nr:Single-stranded-DNA-specific exonuclease RecJ [Burkholderiales bacterium]